MLVDIYQSLIQPSKYIAVPAGTNAANLATLTGDPDFANAKFFKQRDFQPGDKRVAIDTDDAIKSVTDRGWCYLRY